MRIRNESSQIRTQVCCFHIYLCSSASKEALPPHAAARASHQEGQGGWSGKYPNHSHWRPLQFTTSPMIKEACRSLFRYLSSQGRAQVSFSYFCFIHFNILILSNINLIWINKKQTDQNDRNECVPTWKYKIRCAWLKIFTGQLSVAIFIAYPACIFKVSSAICVRMRMY